MGIIDAWGYLRQTVSNRPLCQAGNGPGTTELHASIAIRIDPEIRERVAEWRAGLWKACPHFQWTDPRWYHVTLKYLGDIQSYRGDYVRRALARAAESTPSFSMRIRAIGFFPPSGAPRVVWMGVQEPTGALARCRAAVEAATAATGFESDPRPFRPHLTVARCPNPLAAEGIQRLVYNHRNFDAGEMLVRQIVFLQTIPTRRGVRISMVSAHELKC